MFNLSVDVVFQERCYEYWPDTEGGDTTRWFDGFRVTQQRRIVMPEWIQTTLDVTNKQQQKSRCVQHFLMTSWPACGLPDHRSLIKFLVKLRPYFDNCDAPPVIHCWYVTTTDVTIHSKHCIIAHFLVFPQYTHYLHPPTAQRESLSRCGNCSHARHNNYQSKKP